MCCENICFVVTCWLALFGLLQCTAYAYQQIFAVSSVGISHLSNAWNAHFGQTMNEWIYGKLATNIIAKRTSTSNNKQQQQQQKEEATRTTTPTPSLICENAGKSGKYTGVKRTLSHIFRNKYKQINRIQFFFLYFYSFRKFCAFKFHVVGICGLHVCVCCVCTCAVQIRVSLRMGFDGMRLQMWVTPTSICQQWCKSICH